VNEFELCEFIIYPGTAIVKDGGPVADEAVMANTLYHLHKVYDKEKQALDLLGHHHFGHGGE